MIKRLLLIPAHVIAYVMLQAETGTPVIILDIMQALLIVDVLAAAAQLTRMQTRIMQ